MECNQTLTPRHGHTVGQKIDLWVSLYLHLVVMTLVLTILTISIGPPTVGARALIIAEVVEPDHRHSNCLAITNPVFTAPEAEICASCNWKLSSTTVYKLELGLPSSVWSWNGGREKNRGSGQHCKRSSLWCSQCSLSFFLVSQVEYSWHEKILFRARE